MSSNQNNCHDEVRALFRKLRSWQKESQGEFAKIMNSQSQNINKGINDLVEEVSDLRTQLSTMTKERGDLLGIIDNLTDENNQLRAELEQSKAEN